MASKIAKLPDSKMTSEIAKLPDTMLAEILKRLSVQTLLLCRCVQKSWYHFLQTPYFTNLQFIYRQINNTHLNPPPKYLLFKDTFGNNIFQLRYDDKQCQEFPIKIQIPPALLDKHTDFKMSTSYGLICLYCYSTSFPRCLKYAFYDIYLWNPLVQKYKVLPDVPLIPPHIFSCRLSCWGLAFGYVPQINDYRVVTIINYYEGKCIDGNISQSSFICVYSLTTNSWKKIIIKDDIGLIIIRDDVFEPVILDGIAFWLAITVSALQILCYDIMNEVLDTIVLPMGLDKYPNMHGEYPHICKFSQSIVCIRKDYQEPAHMWVLKRGPMKEFYWEKKICVNLDESARVKIVGSRNNGELIFPQLYQCHLVSYNVEEDEVNEFVQFWYIWFSHGIARGKNNYDFEDRKLDIVEVPFSVYPFVESLVLLDASKSLTNASADASTLPLPAHDDNGGTVEASNPEELQWLISMEHKAKLKHKQTFGTNSL